MLLVVGLISPSELARLIRRRLSRRHIAAIFGGLAAVCFVIFALTTEQPESITPPTGTELDGTYVVVRVIDGDTIEIEKEDVLETVRLIGIDAPETLHPERPPECFGEEAATRLEELVLNEEVRFYADLTRTDRDRYDRLLRYVYLDDGHINERLIADGYAYEYTAADEYAYQEVFLSAEAEAREQQLGLWHPDTCDGQRELDQEPMPDGVVKMSGAGICHAPGTTYYDVTANFTPHDSLQDCLDDGGRLPRR